MGARSGSEVVFSVPGSQNQPYPSLTPTTLEPNWDLVPILCNTSGSWVATPPWES